MSDPRDHDRLIHRAELARVRAQVREERERAQRAEAERDAVAARLARAEKSLRATRSRRVVRAADRVAAVVRRARGAARTLIGRGQGRPASTAQPAGTTASDSESSAPPDPAPTVTAGAAARLAAWDGVTPLRIAGWITARTATDLAPDAVVLDLRDATAAQVREFDPHLVLIEPEERLPGDPAEPFTLDDRLRAHLHDARARHVATALWDTAETDRSSALNAHARAVDGVFTVDGERIAHYARVRADDNVWTLPFAARASAPDSRTPRPVIAVREQWDADAPSRQRPLADLVSAVAEAAEVELADPGAGAQLPALRVPDGVRALTVANGSGPDDQGPPAAEIVAVTARTSPSFVPRRAMELAAAGVPMIAPYQRGIHVMFGSLVALADGGRPAREAADVLTGDAAHRARVGEGLRALVAEHHTPAHRLRQLVAALTAEPVAAPLPTEPRASYADPGDPLTADTLLVADAYPRYDDLYRYGFVHTRVRAYLDRGHAVDVFRYLPRDDHDRYEYDGVPVETGGADALERALGRPQVGTVLVHFLSPHLWKILQRYPHLNIVIWVHGSDIQAWWRRPWLDEATRARAERTSDARAAMWRDLLDARPENVRLVFVSRWLMTTALGDLERTIPASAAAVIPNPINTTLFRGAEKDAAQRTRILSIRPYVGPVYGNDLAVEAVLLLSREPWFGELEFRFVGSGPLFESTLAPLRGFSNVVIDEGYLAPDQIAALHREYGVFLVPTRSDTHGVSRDEAMSSGLVPVTSDVAAVGEFVSEREGYLAPADDAAGLAAAIAELYHRPELFARLSAAAAARVRSSTAIDVIVDREWDFITRRGDDPAPQAP